MALFKIENSDGLESIKEQPFKLEKDIQSLTEKNLKSIFRLDFVKSEFSLNSFCIDTLAFDKDAGTFVIIEYKRDKNFSVIDQGYAYLSLMLNNKADFILEYNENSKETLKRNDVDWSQSRVIFIMIVSGWNWMKKNVENALEQLHKKMIAFDKAVKIYLDTKYIKTIRYSLTNFKKIIKCSSNDLNYVLYSCWDLD